MAPLLRFETAERGFVRNVVERHSPQAGLFTDRFVESEAIHNAFAPVMLERRDTINSPSGEPVVSTPPLTASAKALAGIIVFLGIVVLAVAALRVRKFMRNRRARGFTSPRLKSLGLCESSFPEKVISERRNPMFTKTLLDLGYDGLQPPSKVWSQPEKSKVVYSDSEAQYVGWVPQITTWPKDTKGEPSPDLIPRPYPLPPAPAAARSSRFSRLTAIFTRSPKPSLVSFDVAPPYSSTAPTPRSMTPVNVPSPLSSAETSSPKPASSPASVESNSSTKKKLPPPPIRLPRVPVPAYSNRPVSTITALDSDTPDVVIVSASSDSAVEMTDVKSPSRLDSAPPANLRAPDVDDKLLHVPVSSRPSSKRTSSSSTAGPGRESEGKDGLSGKKLPRLVIAVSTFTPNMQDELHIRVGEVLRLTQEFQDGWCSVERIGTDAEQGVVPRFCITERASFVPDPVKTLSLTNGARLAFTGSTTYSQSTKASTPRSSGVPCPPNLSLLSFLSSTVYFHD
ncbi:uncharacterized protein FOMMEDRAFT_141294 [Fomitiporia mediterranea MF3/22]|uniref:uncharacterized protein n=1 Tax=Fomitiporia mediterranea (strain MF3/22) TaxID=694068 RepID=UPI0004408B4B|nr:uncharacterized protein FOMMEDRAFT_141294 [Fomitiporia mediterranea MF3/22]EJD02153.1 hypothetical protein FOMMEDRAFT_141294 [Fomitiporia mediterranea MF3/22]